MFDDSTEVETYLPHALIVLGAEGYESYEVLRRELERLHGEESTADKPLSCQLIVGLGFPLLPMVQLPLAVEIESISCDAGTYELRGRVTPEATKLTLWYFDQYTFKATCYDNEAMTSRIEPVD